MSEALVLSVFILLMTLGLAWLVYWSGPRFAAWGEPRTRLTAGGFALGGVIASFFAYSVTTAIDRSTLFETRFKGNGGTRQGDPVVTRSASFAVEHPGNAHTLMLSPRKPFAQLADFAITIHLRLWERRDQPLIDTHLTFEPQQRVSTDRNGYRHVYWEWDSVTYDFKPPEQGLHYLEVDFLNVDTPDFYLRIEDPLKTDGQRNPALR